MLLLEKDKVTLFSTIAKSDLVVDGAVFTENKCTPLEGTTPDDNAQFNGGAIHVQSKGNRLKLLNNTRFVGNKAATDGGALHVVAYARAEVDACVFARNIAGDNGGAAHFTVWSTGKFSGGCSFGGNQATRKGGALSATGESYLSVAGSLFEPLPPQSEYNPTDEPRPNKSFQYGGATYLRCSEGKVKANRKFVGNVAQKDGGGIYALSADEGLEFEIVEEDTILTVERAVEFTENKAQFGTGGAIYIRREPVSESDPAYLTIGGEGTSGAKVSFSKNVAGVGLDSQEPTTVGGVVAINAATVKIEHARFSENRVTQLEITNDASYQPDSIVVSRCTFIGVGEAGKAECGITIEGVVNTLPKLSSLVAGKHTIYGIMLDRSRAKLSKARFWANEIDVWSEGSGKKEIKLCDFDGVWTPAGVSPSMCGVHVTDTYPHGETSVELSNFCGHRFPLGRIAVSYGYSGISAMRVLAQRNWWGSPQGPYDPSDDRPQDGLHNNNPQGDYVSNAVDYRDWLKTQHYIPP